MPPHCEPSAASVENLLELEAKEAVVYLGHDVHQCDRPVAVSLGGRGVFSLVQCGQVGQLVVEGFLGMKLCLEKRRPDQGRKFYVRASEEFGPQCVRSSGFVWSQCGEVALQTNEGDAVRGISWCGGGESGGDVVVVVSGYGFVDQFSQFDCCKVLEEGFSCLCVSGDGLVVAVFQRGGYGRPGRHIDHLSA